MTSWRWWAAALLVATGCEAEEKPKGLEEHPVVSAFRESSSLKFEPCGVAYLRYIECDDWSCEQRCKSKQLAAFQCLVDAFEACRPAHMQMQYYSEGSGTILTEYFVVPVGHGCEIVEFEDLTHLRDHCRTVSRSTCRSLQIENGPESCWLNTSCYDYETLVEDTSASCEF